MNPPSAMEAATRLVCLTSLEVRSFLEDELARVWPAEAMVAHARIAALLDWLRNERLLGRFSAQESQAMAKPIGGWSAVEQVNASWRIESAGVIAWSLDLRVRKELGSSAPGNMTATDSNPPPIRFHKTATKGRLSI